MADPKTSSSPAQRLPSVRINRGLSTPEGTPGVLTILNHPFTCHTLELPWEANARGESCIPAGRYRCEWQISPRLGRFVCWVRGVPGRAAVQIHPGNFAGDTDRGFASDVEGCVLVGLEVGRGRKHGTGPVQTMVLKSRAAFDALAAALERAPFDLEIVWTGPNPEAVG